MHDMDHDRKCHSNIDGFDVTLNRSADAASSFFGLTKRETQVLDAITRGRTMKQTALEMKITISTANTYKQRCIVKMDVSSAMTAVALYAAFCGGADVARTKDFSFNS